MYYSPSVEIRKPLVFATAAQLENPRVLAKVKDVTRTVLGWCVENPQNQYAVACEKKTLRTIVTGLQLGTYFTREEAELDNWSLPGYDLTPVGGIYYRPLIEGSPSGPVSTHTTDLVDRLVKQGAYQLDGHLLLTDPNYVKRELNSLE